MAKKIFDIFPPKSIFQKDREPKLVLEKAGPSLISKKKWLGLLLVIIFLAGFGYFQLPRAKIEIWPETDILNFKEKITASSKVEKIDFSAKIIPAKLFANELTLSEEFSASGKKEKRAEGIIRVYNAYSTSPQVLVATTRFVSADGKLFRTPVSVTIPGGHYEKGKLVPGFTDILVRADQPGAEYNIGPSTFSIPGFAGTEKYTAFYGKSFSNMRGGGIVSQVTEEDLAKAQKSLTEKALKDGKSSLKKEIPLDFVLFDEALFQEIIEATSTAKTGEEVSAFNFQIKVKSQALAFKKSDLDNLVKEFVISMIAQDSAEKKSLPESLEVNYWPEPIDLKSDSNSPTTRREGKIVLSLEISVKIYSEIDEIAFKKGISGKSLAETQILLENQPQIIKFQVKLWPFWVRKVPENLEKIKIKLNFD